MPWLRATFLPLSLVILGAAGMVVPLPAFVESPGKIVPLASCVDIADPNATQVSGDFLLMTITVLRASAFDAVVAGFDPDADVVAQGHIVPRGVDANQYFRQQRAVFDLSGNVAVAVGLQAAGMPAEVNDAGARVLQVQRGTPAARVLQTNDVITRIGDEPVPHANALRRIVSPHQPGDTLALRVLRHGEPVQLELETVQYGGETVIGVVAETAIEVELPFAVEVDSGSVGGPSAGLTIALTVYDKVLPGVDLAAGRTIAGTGTIDREGRVGPVGGAGLKVIAASRAGADVFLVPAVNADEARAALPDGSEMEIVPVGTFDQARQALERTAGDGAGTVTPQPCPHDQAA